MTLTDCAADRRSAPVPEPALAEASCPTHPQSHLALDGTILVAQCRLPPRADAAYLARGLSLLPPHLHPDITRYHRLEDRLARLVARLLIRASLHALGLVQEGALEHWRKDGLGRPYLQGSGADISISHAHPWVVTAMGIRRRVGIDVETFHPVEQSAITPYLTPLEQERIRHAERPEVEALLCWSLREAILKADGRGLLAPEAEIRDIGAARTPAGEPWQVERLEFSGGCLYLACDRQAACLRREEWEGEGLLVG